MDIISKEKWGAEPPRNVRAKPDEYLGVEVHHTASPTIASIKGKDEGWVIRQIQRDHLGRGWNDIFYNLFTFPSGNTYEGRGDTDSGMLRHCFIGNFMEEKPTPEQVAVLLESVAEVGGKLDTHTWRGTREGKHQSACPGDNMIEIVTSILEGTLEGDKLMENPKEFVEALYSGVFGRSAADDPEGAAYWEGRLAEGTTQFTALLHFMTIERAAQQAAITEVAHLVGVSNRTAAAVRTNTYDEFMDNMRALLWPAE